MVPLKTKGGPDEREADCIGPQRNALKRLTCHSLLIKDPEQKSTGHRTVIQKLWKEGRREKGHLDRKEGWESSLQHCSNKVRTCKCLGRIKGIVSGAY